MLSLELVTKRFGAKTAVKEVTLGEPRLILADESSASRSSPTASMIIPTPFQAECGSACRLPRTWSRTRAILGMFHHANVRQRMADRIIDVTHFAFGA